MTTSTTDPAQRPNVPIGLALKEAAIAGVIAAVINFVFVLVARLVTGVGGLVVDTPATDIVTMPFIIAFSIVPALIAGVVYWALDRFLANPNPAFLGISALVFIAFLIGPIASTDSAAVGWILQITHGIVAVPVIMAMLSLKAKV